MNNLFGPSEAIFQRIAEAYRLDGDTAIGRHLGITNQNVYQYRKRGTIPFEAILETCPPADWEYLLLGTRSAPTLDTAQMLKALVDAGYRVEKAP